MLYADGRLSPLGPLQKYDLARTAHVLLETRTEVSVSMSMSVSVSVSVAVTIVWTGTGSMTMMVWRTRWTREHYTRWLERRG